MDLLDQIRYEGENTGFDFKAIAYKSEKFEDLLKDIMAMANADLDRDRFIVVGVKHHPSGERDIMGIDEFIDDASYYQLVHSNIEPDIHFEYSYLQIDDKTVGVFRIFNCDNPPYMLKKDSKTLRKGDSYIRKGTSQMKLMRADIDRIFAKRQVVPDLAAKLEAIFEVDGQPSNRMTPEMDSGLPSASAARRIRWAIADKELTAEQREAKRQALLDKTKNPAHKMFNLLDKHPALKMMNRMTASASGLGTPYEERDLDTLREDLESVQKAYREADLHYQYEERARKINILLSNHGEQYIENCSVEIRIKKAFGLVVAPSIYRKPKKHSHLISMAALGPDYEALDYPKVTETEESYFVKAYMGDLPHNITTAVLKVPARLTLPVNTAGQQVEVTLTLFGKNLPKPYVKSMLIDVV